jgi:tRNA threonylcarbamoyladenosine modification (KEOPS) complex Cgi121 subunit
MELTIQDSELSEISFHVYREVENAAEIRSTIFSSKLPICLVQPQLVWDQFQLKAGIAKALQNEKDGTMKTRTFATEILYWLSPSTNISESLKKVGAGDEAREILVLSKEEDFLKIRDLIKGTEIPLEEMGKLRDSQRISEAYGVNQVGELYKSRDDLLSSFIVSKMMTKELC